LNGTALLRLVLRIRAQKHAEVCYAVQLNSRSTLAVAIEGRAYSRADGDDNRACFSPSTKRERFQADALSAVGRLNFAPTICHSLPPISSRYDRNSRRRRTVTEFRELSLRIRARSMLEIFMHGNPGFLKRHYTTTPILGAANCSVKPAHQG
jgi:hypothetical protein